VGDKLLFPLDHASPTGAQRLEAAAAAPVSVVSSSQYAARVT